MNELDRFKPSGIITPSLLGIRGDDDTSHLEDYLDADFIIVDEFSMVDTFGWPINLSPTSPRTVRFSSGDSDHFSSVSPGRL